MQRLIFTERRPMLWRTLAAFVAGVLFASLVLGVRHASAAALRIEHTSFRDGITRTRTETLPTWNACVRGAHTLRAQVVTATRLRLWCNERRI